MWIDQSRVMNLNHNFLADEYQPIKQPKYRLKKKEAITSEQ